MLSLTLAAPGVAAQERPAERPKPAEAPPPPPPRPVDEVRAKSTGTAYRLFITLTETDGAKTTANLPYVLNGIALSDGAGVPASIRMGIRVPIQTSPTQLQYQNIGTDIDCSARVVEPGRLSLRLSVRRSSVRIDEATAEGSAGRAPGQPVMQEFSGASEILLRDGQGQQITLATDPHSGRVLKVDAKLELLKP